MSLNFLLINRADGIWHSGQGAMAGIGRYVLETNTIFRFSGQGNLMWKQSISKHGVYSVDIDGIRIIDIDNAYGLAILPGKNAHCLCLQGEPEPDPFDYRKTPNRWVFGKKIGNVRIDKYSEFLRGSEYFESENDFMAFAKSFLRHKVILFDDDTHPIILRTKNWKTHRLPPFFKKL